MKKKQRGSAHGLVRNREETKCKNTEALWWQVKRLRNEKPNVPWSYKEVWSGAGLKSNVALDSPWNAHIKESILEHNREASKQKDLGPIGQLHPKTVHTTNKELLQEVERLKAEQNKALTKVAVWEAEATYLKHENQRLQRRLDRLKSLQR